MRCPLLIVFTSLVFLVSLTSASMAAQTEGMIAHWKFDEGSGATAKDSIGGYDGTLQGETTGKLR